MFNMSVLHQLPAILDYPRLIHTRKSYHMSKRKQAKLALVIAAAAASASATQVAATSNTKQVRTHTII